MMLLRYDIFMPSLFCMFASFSTNVTIDPNVDSLQEMEARALWREQGGVV